MFGSKRRIIEEKLKQIEREKQELLKIKEILEDNYPKIDIKDLYVFSVDDISYIVRMQVDKKPGIDYFQNKIMGNHSKLIDVFSNKIIYEKFSYHLIDREEYIGNCKQEYYFNDDYAYLKPILEVEKNLLSYTNGFVPTYILMNLYYKLNNVDINSSLLIKKKELM